MKVLSDAGHPMGFGEIQALVSATRPIKRGSLQMYLDLDPRFYKSIQGAYGLRSWLPPRERQTLGTPDWQVEDRKSYQRILKRR
jgi:hypothetical protein